MQKLKPSDELFLERYIGNGFNMTAAYSSCHPRASNSTSSREASRKLKDPRFRSRLNELVMDRMTLERSYLQVQLLELLKRRAFYDPLDYIDIAGNLKSDFDPESLKGVIDNLESSSPDGQRVKIKFASRDKAIDYLLRLLELSAEQSSCEPEQNVRVIMLPESITPEQWTEKFGQT